MKKISYRKIMESFVGVLSLIFWALVLLGFNSIWVAVLTLISAVIHECGHLLGLWLIGRPTPTLRAVVSGFRIKIPELLSYKEELVVLSLGPLMNIAVGSLLLLLWHGNFLFTFALINLLTALSNLLPIETYDGYRIAEAIVGLFSLSHKAVRVLRGLSLIFIVFMTFFSLYLVLRVGSGFWIFAIFFYSMIKRLSAFFNDKNQGFSAYS